LASRQPNALAFTFRTALRLEETIWIDFCDALPTLISADSCVSTSQIVFRDLYLLVRSDVLIVDANSTNELALLASLLGIPVVAVSYQPILHPWLLHCARTTINSPENIAQIVDSIPPITPNTATSEDCLPPDDEFGPVTGQELGEPDSLRAPEKAPVYEYTCDEGHEFTCDRIVSCCVVEDCGAEGVAECGSPVIRRTQT